MGVKGLFQFLRRFEKQVDIPKYVLNKSVGIDIFWFLHKSKGDFFQLETSLLSIINNAKKVYCVFDGIPSETKKELLQEQAKKRKEINKSIDEIEKYLKYPFNQLSNLDRHLLKSYLNQLKREAWQPSPQFINTVKNWLINKNCEIIEALKEADEVLIELERKDEISVIITNDSDLLILGSTNILRPKDNLRATIYNKSELSKKLGFTKSQWNDFMYLCYYMKNTDINLAYSLISVYKDLDYIEQKYFILYNDELILENSKKYYE